MIATVVLRLGSLSRPKPRRQGSSKSLGAARSQACHGSTTWAACPRLRGCWRILAVALGGCWPVMPQTPVFQGWLPLALDPGAAGCSGSGGSICSISWMGSTASPAPRRRRSAPVGCCSPRPGPAPIRHCRARRRCAPRAIGFLVWNWSPAKIFLGDVGSVPLGYLLGFLLLEPRRTDIGRSR